MKNTANLNRLIQSAKNKKEVDVATSFLQDFRYSLIQEELQERNKPSPTYKPSSFKCIRNMYFQRTEEELDEFKPNPSLKAITESGSDRHERIQGHITRMNSFGVKCQFIKVRDYLTEAGLLDEFDILEEGKYETKLQHKTLHVRFLCDGILKYNDEYYILEIKTETSYKWQERKNFDEKHRNQVVAYSALLKINKVLFIYENRDLCDWKCFLLNVSKEMHEELVYKPIEECEKYILEKSIPPISKIINKKDCKYCNYKNKCKLAGGWIWS